jgi:hypothetical protein
MLGKPANPCVRYTPFAPGMEELNLFLVTVSFGFLTEKWQKKRA